MNIDDSGVDVPSASLSFVDKVFYHVDEAGEKNNKNIISIDCSEDAPKYFSTDNIYLLRNYKGMRSKGRKDGLKGKDVLALQTEKGIWLFPVDELDKLANYLFSIFLLLKKRENDENKITKEESSGILSGDPC